MNALTEARAMLTELQSAQTLADLDAIWAKWVGHSAIESDPETTFESLRDDLDDYIVEFCYASGVHCADVFPDFDETLRA